MTTEPDVEVRTSDVPAMPVVTETAVLDQVGLEAWLPGAMGRVVERAAAEGGEPGDPVFDVVWPTR